MRVRMPMYGAVPISMNIDPSLTFSDMKVYVALASFQGSNDDAFPSREAIVERCGLALETVSRSVVHLVELGWIQRDRRPNESSIYRVMMEVSEVTPKSLPGSDPQVTPEVTPKSLPSIKQKEQLKEQAKTTKENQEWREVIAYLNTKTGSKFRDTKGHATTIKARFKEGYTLEDFKIVIDKRVAKWAKDPKMVEYLRPSTLFCSHFDEYLNDNSTPLFAPQKEEPDDSWRFVDPLAGRL